MNSVCIGGRMYRLVAFLDEDKEQISDAAAASFVLAQRPEDIRPEGERQTYRIIEILKGSMRPMQ